MTSYPSRPPCACELTRPCLCYDEALRKRVRSYFLSKGLDRTDADSLTNETFERAVIRPARAKAGDLGIRTTPVAYLLAAARNVYVDELRRRSRRLPLASQQQQDWAEPAGLAETDDLDDRVSRIDPEAFRRSLIDYATHRAAIDVRYRVAMLIYHWVLRTLSAGREPFVPPEWGVPTNTRDEHFAAWVAFLAANPADRGTDLDAAQARDRQGRKASFHSQLMAHLKAFYQEHI